MSARSRERRLEVNRGAKRRARLRRGVRRRTHPWARCAECRGTFAVKRDGTLWRHADLSGAAICRGSDCHPAGTIRFPSVTPREAHA